MPRTTERGFCMAWCRRFGLQSTLVSPDAPHAPSCNSAAGINGAHATVCTSTARERTYSNNRFVRNVAKVARRPGYLKRFHGNSLESTARNLTSPQIPSWDRFGMRAWDQPAVRRRAAAPPEGGGAPARVLGATRCA